MKIVFLEELEDEDNFKDEDHLEDEDYLEDEDCFEDEDDLYKNLKLKTILKMKRILKMEFVHARMCIGIFAMEKLLMQQSKDVLWHLCNGCALASCYDIFLKYKMMSTRL